MMEAMWWTGRPSSERPSRKDRITVVVAVSLAAVACGSDT